MWPNLCQIINIVLHCVNEILAAMLEEDMVGVCVLQTNYDHIYNSNTTFS